MHEQSADSTPIPAIGKARRFRRAWIRFDETVLRICARLLGPAIEGGLQLTLPSGARATLGNTTPTNRLAHLSLHTYAAFWKSLRRGSVGFGDSYVAGEIDSDDLATLFRFFIDNRSQLHRAGRGKFRVHLRDHVFHRSRANTRAGSRANIAAHYDLGNDFYRLWLDSSMTYSSGLYTSPDLSLAGAQQAKYDLVLDALELTPGHRLLEIGCGWGALACQAATRGARVTGLTLSSQQLAAARHTVREQGHEAHVDLRLEDYRDVGGVYDRIVSIEMIEAVGEENWPRYFSTLYDRLAPGGTVVLQAISIDESIFEAYRNKADFIQRYIFPGGMLPTRALITHHAQAAGFEVEPLQSFGLSYARTLAEWRQRFNSHWPAVRALGFDERFRRMWDYYLAYCQAGFERGATDVGIYRLRPRNATTPTGSL